MDNRMTYYVLSEVVTDCHKRYRSLLPADLRPMLDDLVELHDDITVCNALARLDDKTLRIYERSVMRLAEYFMNELKGK